MEEKKREEKIGEALMKVALGYQIAEVTEEYAEVDGALKLTKRKKTKKDVPPDLKAVQMLLSGEGNGEYGQWTDEELEEEKRKLLLKLQEAELGADSEVSGGKKGTKTSGTVKKKTSAESKTATKPKPRKRVVRKKEE